MQFQKKTWKDRLSEFPGRRKLKDVNTNAESVYDVSRAEGETFQAGDAFSAENMNDLEQRIDNVVKDLTDNYSITDVAIVNSIPADSASHPTILYLSKS